MQSVGTRLRDARSKKGYTLEEISARTRINIRNLSAIEYDQVSELSSPFLYRSFVRQYAQEVGAEYNLLAPAVEMLAGNMRQPELPGQGEHQAVTRVTTLQVRPKADFSWIVPAAVFVCSIVLGSGGYAAWKIYKPIVKHQNLSVSSLATAESTPTSANSHTAETNLVIPNASQAAANQIHLELAATERTWLSVSADGKAAFTGTLEPTETKVLDSQESARLRTGNAGGVNIIFNGKSIGIIGPRGKPRTVVFTKSGYEIQPTDPIATFPANHIGG